MARATLPRLAEPPSWEEAAAMDSMLEASVEPRFIDLMGHMNVAFYVHLFDRATWSFFERMGIDEPYRKQTQAGMFAVEQHLRYLGELREGDALRIHTRLLDLGPKALTLLHVMLDPARTRLAAVSEVVGVHIDLATRRAARFPDPIAANLRERLLDLPRTGADAPSPTVTER
jgi:acyl-CoA thioester hydrolase